MSTPPRGRTLQSEARPPDKPVAAPAPVPPSSPPSVSPFAQYGPGAGSMGEMAEENRSQSLGILAIVGGLGFALAAVGGLLFLVIAGWLLYSAATGETPLATVQKDKQHVRDTGFATPHLPEPGQAGPGKSGASGPRSSDPSAPPAPTGPPPGPIGIIVGKEMMFLSIEVNCPGGYRSRGDFRKDTKTTKRATVSNVPGGERCTVTFQGSEPAKVWATANTTLTCTFGPVVCHPVN